MLMATLLIITLYAYWASAKLSCEEEKEIKMEAMVQAGQSYKQNQKFLKEHDALTEELKVNLDKAKQNGDSAISMMVQIRVMEEKLEKYKPALDNHDELSQ